MENKILRALVLSLVFILSFTLVVSANPPASPNAVNNQQAALRKIYVPQVSKLSGGAVANHNSLATFANIPTASLQAAAGLKTLFMHQSTGDNIRFMGLGCLAGQRVGWPDYPLECDTYATSPYNNSNLVWPIWPDLVANAYAKTDMWVSIANAQQSNYQVLGMKFCYTDGYNEDFQYYKSKMEQLEKAYPQKIFIWATSALYFESNINSSVGNLLNAQNIQTFNQALRTYARANHKFLYDIADIESHDPAGNYCQASGIEGLCNVYSPGMGGGGDGHPNVDGSIRLAKGFWSLMASIAGWSGNSY